MINNDNISDVPAVDENKDNDSNNAPDIDDNSNINERTVVVYNPNNQGAIGCDDNEPATHVTDNTNNKEQRIVNGYTITNGDWTENTFAITNFILESNPVLAESYVKVIENKGNDKAFLTRLINNGFQDLVVNTNNKWLKEANFI